MNVLRAAFAFCLLIPLSATADDFISEKASVKDPEKFLQEQKKGFDREYAKLSRRQQEQIKSDAKKLKEKIAAQKGASPLEAAQFIASGFGIPPESKIAKRFAKQIQKRNGGIVRGVPTGEPQGRPPVIQHITFRSGVPFPSSSSIDTELETYTPPTSQVDNQAGQEQIQSGNREIREKRSEKVRKLFTPGALPSCEESRKHSIANDAKHWAVRRASKDEVLFDALFLKNDAPKNGDLLTGFDQLFGDSVRVHHYTEEYGDPISTLVSSYGITCLPFRIRVTKEKIQRFYGEDALLSYSMPKGKKRKKGNLKKSKGRLHPLVERRLRDFY